MHRIGFVYVLSNPAMPGVVKIGKTAGGLAEDRAKQLQATGVPLPFHVEFRAATSYPDEAEKQAHEYLEYDRVATNREFFAVSIAVAIDAVRQALIDVGGVQPWFESESQHYVKRGDRIALTLEAGQIFVVLSYSLAGLMSGREEVLDIWQAHTDGDLLELMGTDKVGDVAGMSDNDQQSCDDLVPHLDRDGKVPNGAICGRERLVPGERLLWFAPLPRGDGSRIAIFEMTDHCQVIARTWEAKFAPCGFPLLLNVLTYDELPPSVIRGTHAALRMHLPRAWAPRSGDTLHDPADNAGVTVRPPDFWLRQLEPRARAQAPVRRTKGKGGRSTS